MITEPARERRRPRRAYSFERVGALWMALGKGVERAEFIGGGPCGSFAARGEASGAYTPLNLPGFALLRSWVTAQRRNSLSFNLQMQEFGTIGTNHVNLTGTSSRLVDPRIEVTTGGSRSATVFRWSEDGGLNWTSGVSADGSGTGVVALGTTGLSANFLVGTYNTNNIYVGKIVQWNDVSGQSNHYENALAGDGVALPKVSLASLNGRPSLYFKKAENNFLRRASSAYCTELCGGEDTPMTAFTVAQLVSGPTAAHGIWSITNTTASTSAIAVATPVSGSGQWVAVARGDTGSELDAFGGTQDLNLWIFEYVRFGTTVSLLLTNASGTTTVINAVAQNANSLTVAQAFLGATRSGANVSGDILIGEDLKYVTALDVDTRGAIRGYLKRQWGL